MDMHDVIRKAKYLVDMYSADSFDPDIDAITEAEKTLPYDVLAVQERSVMYPDNAVANVSNVGYNEAHALQNLLVAIESALVEENNAMENGVFCNSQFTININGKSIAFYLGGPQCDALYDFVEHICGENLYGLDRTNNTVKGWNDK